MLANYITISRVPLLLLVILFIAFPSVGTRIAAVPLILVLIALDSLDGWVARARGESSILGSVLDIAADRAVEYTLWVTFAVMGLVSLWIPVIVLLRGTFVDAFRSVAPARGLAPFDLLRSQLGRFLVGSPWLRAPYALVKALAFSLLALVHALQTMGSPSAGGWNVIAQAAAWLAFALCLVRGLPVIVEAPGVLMEK